MRFIICANADSIAIKQQQQQEQQQQNRKRGNEKQKRQQQNQNQKRQLLEDMPKDYRGRYYYEKFNALVHIDDEFLLHLKQVYMEGLQWCLSYYYRGCVSWSWFYPYHYGPLTSDLADLTNNNNNDSSNAVAVDGSQEAVRQSQIRAGTLHSHLQQQLAIQYRQLNRS